MTAARLCKTAMTPTHIMALSIGRGMRLVLTNNQSKTQLDQRIVGERALTLSRQEGIERVVDQLRQCLPGSKGNLPQNPKNTRTWRDVCSLQCLQGGHIFEALRKLETASATLWASIGGTAFPICITFVVAECGNAKSSGNVCRRAHSLTVNLLSKL